MRWCRLSVGRPWQLVGGRGTKGAGGCARHGCMDGCRLGPEPPSLGLASPLLTPTQAHPSHPHGLPTVPAYGDTVPPTIQQPTQAITHRATIRMVRLAARGSPTLSPPSSSIIHHPTQPNPTQPFFLFPTPLLFPHPFSSIHLSTQCSLNRRSTSYPSYHSLTPWELALAALPSASNPRLAPESSQPTSSPAASTKPSIHPPTNNRPTDNGRQPFASQPAGLPP